MSLGYVPSSASSLFPSAPSAPPLPPWGARASPRAKRGEGRGPPSDALLLRLNFGMAAFHACLVALTLGAGNLSLDAPLFDVAYSLNATASAERGGEVEGWTLLPTGGDVALRLPLTWLTALFFALSSAFHLSNATLFRTAYLSLLRECRCPSRWAEYFFSASLMAALIAYTSGTNLLLPAAAVCFLTATTMLFGHLTEQLARPDGEGGWTRGPAFRLQAHFMGYLPQAGAWFLILYQFHLVGEEATSLPSGNCSLSPPTPPPPLPPCGSGGGCCLLSFSMPDFVYAIVWGEAVVFWSFGAVQLAVTSLPPRFYAWGEVAYQLLSLLSKGLLGGILVANVLVLSDVNDAYSRR